MTLLKMFSISSSSRISSKLLKLSFWIMLRMNCMLYERLKADLRSFSP
jgi:hypothetical protein